MDRAFVCRYGHQNIYTLLGRDPLKRPLTRLEFAVLCRCLQEHWDAEVTPRKELGLPED